MANHELVLGHGQDAAELALGQSHHDFGQDHLHGLDLSHHDLDLVLSQSHDHVLVLGHHQHDSHLVLGTDHHGHHTCDLALRQGHEDDLMDDGEGPHDLSDLALTEPPLLTEMIISIICRSSRPTGLHSSRATTTRRALLPSPL